MRASVLALSAIVLWASLAALGKGLAAVPPFLLLSISFAIGGAPGLLRPRRAFPSLRTTAAGVAGLFGYHLFLFLALRKAPAVEANLINYLWPALVVLLSPLLLKEYPLRAVHLAGVALAVFGNVFLVTGGALSFVPAFAPGYLLALAAALTWSTFSVGIKRLAPYSTGAVAGFCLGSAALSFLAHLLLEPSYSLTPGDWLRTVLLGLGPMGLAFYAWDAALKRGDPRVIGALSYLTPLLSTLGLVVFAGEPFHSRTAVALVCVVGGALVGVLGTSGFAFRRIRARTPV